jgi:hypothetical protein
MRFVARSWCASARGRPRPANISRPPARENVVARAAECGGRSPKTISGCRAEAHMADLRVVHNAVHPEEKARRDARREGPTRRPDEKAHTRRHAGSSAGRFGKTVGRGRVRSRIQLVPAKSCSPSVPAKPWQKAKSEPCRVQPPATKPPETKPPRAQPLEPKPATERGSTSLPIRRGTGSAFVTPVPRTNSPRHLTHTP